MSDDLDRLVDSIDSEGPSPEFVAALRARIVAETEGPVLAPRTDEPDDDVIDLRPAGERPARSMRWRAIGMVAAAVVLIVGLIVLARQDDDLEPIDEPSVSTAVPNTVAGPLATFVADATPMGDDEDLLEPGTYRVDALGTPISFTLREPAHASSERASLFLAHPDSQGIDDRTISFIRLSALSDPAEPIVAPGDAATARPADDIDGWLAAVSDEVVITDRVDTALGGLPATRFDLELGTTDCIVGGESCGWFGTNRTVRNQELVPGSVYRIWVVEQGEYDPLAVIVAIDREADREWFDTADEIVSTVAFGQVGSEPAGPNPILAAGAGTVELPFLGGVVVDLPADTFAMLSDGVGRILLDEWPGGMWMVADPADEAGVALRSTEELAAHLRAAGADLTEVEPTLVDGFTTRVFDVELGAPAPSLRVASDANGDWRPPLRGRIWVVEHRDRGPLVIAAGAWENLDIVAPLAVDEATALVESLAFDERG